MQFKTKGRIASNTGHWGGGPTQFQRLMGSNTTTQKNNKAKGDKGRVPGLPKLNLPEYIPEKDEPEYVRRRR